MLTTGPKVLASKIWLGLVKIGNPEVRRAYLGINILQPPATKALIYPPLAVLTSV